MKKLWQQLVNLVKDFFAHWNTPPKEGYYLSNKEFLAYSVGSMGVMAMGGFIGFFNINVGVHLAYVYNFDQSIVLYTNWIAAVLSLLIAPVVGWIMDNTNTKWGKYRPHLLWSGVACIVLYWLLAFIPNLFMPQAGQEYTEVRKWAVIGSYQFILFLATTIYNIFLFGKVGLSQVMTSNTHERTKIYSIGGVIASLGSSLVTLLFPLVASFFYGQDGLKYGGQYSDMTAEEAASQGIGFGLENIRTYQIIFPIMALCFIVMVLIMFFGTKERIIQEKQAKQKKIGFFTGILKSFKNKYFWLMNASTALGFGRLLVFSSVNYVCLYMIGGRLGETMRGILPTIMAVGYTPGMIVSPLIQKRLGKKNMMILSCGASAVLALGTLFLVLFAYEASFAAYLICVAIFLNNFFSALYAVAQPGMTADYCEYQQWKSGDRIDAYMAQYATAFTTVCGMATGFLVTTLLKKYGAYSSADYATPSVMRAVFIVWSIITAVSCVLSFVPFFFWDLNEEKQLAMAKELKIRAYSKDLENGVLEAEHALEAISLGVLTEEHARELGIYPAEVTVIMPDNTDTGEAEAQVAATTEETEVADEAAAPEATDAPVAEEEPVTEEAPVESDTESTEGAEAPTEGSEE